MANKRLSPAELQALHKEIMKKRQEILQEVENEFTMRNLAENLENIRLNRGRIGRNLNEIHREARNRSRSRPRSRSRNRKNKTTQKARRKRVNPEFAALGIPVPPSQQVGEERVRPGEKVKKH